MKKGFRERHLARKWFFAFVFSVLIVFFVWWLLFGVVDCDSFSCFDARLASCDSAVFVGGDDRLIFEYEILGRSGDVCDVRVTLVQGFLSRSDASALEGEFMVCSLPFGVVMRPESDLSLCSGPLKESFQFQLIQKLYAYIVQNIGRINLDVLDVPSSVLSE